MKKLRIFGFLISWMVIFLIVWTLVWSGVKVWQTYNPYSSTNYSGFPYAYSHKTCDSIRCNTDLNLNNLILDIAILLAASFLITLFSYSAKKRIG